MKPKQIVQTTVVFMRNKKLALQFICIVDGVQYTPRLVLGQDSEWNVRIGCVHESALRRCQLPLLQSIGHGLEDPGELCPGSSWVE